MIYYQVWIGQDIPDKYADCMTATRLLIEHSGHDYRLIHIPDFKGTPKDATVFKDRMLFALACIEDFVFLDSDLILKSIFEPPHGKPAFIYEWGTPRIGYFMVNGCHDFFCELMNERRERDIKYGYGYTSRLIRRKKPIEIPRNTYNHLRIISGKHMYF